MSLIDDLKVASSDRASLENHIEIHFAEMYDYFTWGTDQELSYNLHGLKEYLTRQRSVLLSLNKNETNLAFLALLLEVAEQLSFSSAFEYLYHTLLDNGFYVNSRLHASASFLIGVDTANEYISCYEEIYKTLISALEEEEDSDDKVLITIVNYYVKGIEDFPFAKNVAAAIKEKIIESIVSDEYSFLNRPLITDMIETDVTDIDFGVAHIQQRLDEFLKKHKSEDERELGELLETETEYADLIESTETAFVPIRRISVDNYKICGSDSVFRSLQRGVEILKDECQLFGYMNSFGQMHYEKLIQAFDCLPGEIFDRQLNIIDWGCGQAMASMVLQEHCLKNGILPEHYRAILIEPSSLALKRGALHLRKFDPNISLSTVNCDLDSLQQSDFDFLQGNTHLHLFSNILDINFFSLSNLIAMVKERFSGNNYFVVVSPYVDDIKRSRIDTFVNAFQPYPSFSIISKNDDKKGEWVGNWTRVERVFTVQIS